MYGLFLKIYTMPISFTVLILLFLFVVWSLLPTALGYFAMEAEGFLKSNTCRSVLRLVADNPI